MHLIDPFAKTAAAEFSVLLSYPLGEVLQQQPMTRQVLSRGRRVTSIGQLFCGDAGQPTALLRLLGFRRLARLGS